jgi:hypothetical protein
LFAFLLLLSPPTLATDCSLLGPNACLFGFTFGPKVTPVPHVRIEVRGPGIANVRVTYSDDAGRFCLLVPRGPIWITGEAQGLRTRTASNLNVDVGFRVPLRLELSPFENPAYVIDQQLLDLRVRTLTECNCFKDLVAIEKCRTPPQ